jgi:hypothetical protein
MCCYVAPHSVLHNVLWVMQVLPAAVHLLLSNRDPQNGSEAHCCDCDVLLVSCGAGNESHAGQVFTCIGALSLAGRLDACDKDLVAWW